MCLSFAAPQTASEQTCSRCFALAPATYCLLLPLHTGVLIHTDARSPLGQGSHPPLGIPTGQRVPGTQSVLTECVLVALGFVTIPLITLGTREGLFMSSSSLLVEGYLCPSLTLLAVLQSDEGGSVEATRNVEDVVVKIMSVFVDALPHVPAHRRLPILVQLVDTLGPQRFLWLLLVLLFEQYVTKTVLAAACGEKVRT